MCIRPSTARLFAFEPCSFVTFSDAHEHVAETGVSLVDRRRSCLLGTSLFLCLLPSVSDG
jgi:hypothetical protein